MARSYTDLYPRISAFGNLRHAFRKAARGKRKNPEVAAFEFSLESNLVRLQSQLEEHSYRPGPYRSFTIQDPKQRLISAAPFRDRVVHHALCNVIEPLFERTMIGDSYANRRGKGTHAALDRAQAFARRYPYVLQCDLRQFFPSVDHRSLRRVLARKLADPATMELIDVILAGGAGVLEGHYTMVYFRGDDLFAALRPRGLPIGNLTSQFWGNVYLNELDQFVKRVLRRRAYLRYVDDFLVFSDSKRDLWAVKSAIREALVGLRLTLHERSSTVYPARCGIPFLGFRVYPTHRRLRRRNGVAFARRLRSWRRRLAGGEVSLAEFLVRVRGWVAHAKHGDTYGLRRSILSAQPLELPRRAA